MECAVRLAEVNNDTQTDDAEQRQYAAEQARWKMYFEQLLEGVTIEENGRKYSLADRMADQYQEFSDMVDSDIKFMDLFLRCEFCDGVNNLFKGEARTLASIIVG